MVDITKLKSAIRGYKEYFPTHWKDEKYKWIAVKYFQDNWDIDAPDFEKMFMQATAKADNLLISRNVYPAGMILEFTRADEEATREMFRMLFDETLDLAERITAFKNRAEELRQKYGNGEWKNHYQSINYISTYLWLMYPDKYYIYKYELYKKCAVLLDDTYQPKANGAPENVIGGYQMYDEIRAILQEDDEFRQMLDTVLTDECYLDPELITATIDFGHFIGRFYQTDSTQNDDWFPSLEEYTPGLSIEDWTELLHNPNVFDRNSLDVIDAFYDIGGQATCSELAQKYGNTAMHYSGIVSGLAKRISKETNCQLAADDINENAKWWPILFVGKYADKKQQGVYIWKLRDELKEAIAAESEFTKKDTDDYVFIKANTAELTLDEKKSIIALYYARLDSNDPRYKPITTNLEKAAVSLGIKCSSRIIGTMKDHYDPYFENGRIGYTGEKNQRTKLMIAIQNYFESYSTDRLQIIVTAILKNEVLPFLDSYNRSDFLKDVFITDTEYDELRSLVLRKNNIILQGPPGVGKTYAAKRLAWSIMGEKDDSRIAFIQFHQSYSYEDFIMGYRPNGSGGFDLQNGIFYQFCEMTRSNPGKQYFFIIDEINRGNLSKIFGELLMLIEKDYRKESAVLSYSKESFSVPENLYIIGMMNTADRSLALIDYALRRRFSFFEMQPGFDSDGFKTYSKGLNSNLFEALIEKIKQLNNKIKDDGALGEGFMIGHSYFCNLTADTCTADRLRSIVEYDIVPILKEYWFDDKDTATKQADDLRGVFK